MTEELGRVRNVVARELGLELAEDDVLRGALEQRRTELRCSLAQYIDRLEVRTGDARELHALGQLLTIGETYFFRMRGHLDVLRKLAATTEPGPFSVLSAGCSTGEEAYSIAIALRTAGRADAHVLGTDLSQRSLDVARSALYTDWALRSVSGLDRERWFTRNGKKWEVRREVRALVEFRAANLLEDGSVPLGPFDAVFCRNVIMYFTRDAQRTVVARLTASLRSGGLLFLGHAETLRGLSEEYAVEQDGDLFHYRHRRPSSPSPPPVAAPPRPLLTPWIAPVRPTHAVVPDVMTLLADERFAEALAALGEEPTLQRAVALLGTGAISEAEEICMRLIATDEGGAEAHYVLGVAAEARGDRPTAIDRHRAALYLEPDFALAHLQLGRLERREGELDRARRDLRHALELLGHEPAARIALFGGGFDRDALIALGRAELALVERRLVERRP